MRLDKPRPATKTESSAPPAPAAVRERATKPSFIIQKKVFRNGWITRKVFLKPTEKADAVAKPGIEEIICMS